MKKMALLIFASLISFGYGQRVWDTGEIDFSYGFPFADQTLSLSGDLLSGEIPGQGVGGFEILEGDNHQLMLLSYDIRLTAEQDTLADAFVIYMADSVAFSPGEYTVSPDTDALKLMVWLRDVDPAVLVALIDSSFTMDSLATLNPVVSIAGDLEVVSIDQSGLEIHFSGTMVGLTGAITIANGSIIVQSTLPSLVYEAGMLDFQEDIITGSIDGPLNPLIYDSGVGTILAQVADTLTYTMLAYNQTATDVYDVYGVALSGTESDFPNSGFESDCSISLVGETLPAAFPFLVKQVALDEILAMVESGEIPYPGDSTQIFLPISEGNVDFILIEDGHAEVQFQSVLMASSDGSETFFSSQDWLLLNGWIDAVDGKNVVQNPVSNIVGAPFPNPFNSSVIIPLELGQSTSMMLSICNLLGQEVLSMDLGYFGQGRHQIPLNLGSYNLAGGMYYFSLHTNLDQIGSGSLIYLK